MTDRNTPATDPNPDPQRTFLRALAGSTPAAERLEQAAPGEVVDEGREFLRNLIKKGRA